MSEKFNTNQLHDCCDYRSMAISHEKCTELPLKETNYVARNEFLKYVSRGTPNATFV